MVKILAKLLCSIAVCGVAASACGLTIVPTFDSSITGNANGAAIMAGINAAIQDFQTNFTDAVTVQIKFVNSTSVGLGQSSSWNTMSTYHNYITALRSSATSANDTNAISKLTNNSMDPVTGGLFIYLNLPLARTLGLYSGYGSDGFDGTVTLNTTLMNLTRPPTNSQHYDLMVVAEHEMDEVLGTASRLPQNDYITPADLFRYNTNLNRTFTTNGDNSYFSVDGTNLWARYNMNAGGDYGDWWSFTGSFWAPPGVTPRAQVQDAYATPGTFQDLGTNELALLDVVGYTLAVHIPPPVLTIVLNNNPGHVTVSWSPNTAGFSLEERTNLGSGSWIASPSGSTNPAVIMAAGTQNFYQLYQPAAPALVQAQAAQVPSSTTATLQSVTHIFQPRKP